MKGNKWPAAEVVRRKVDELIPYARNSRKHSRTQVKQIAASIKEWGWTTPILVDEENGVIAGHGRLEAAQLLLIEEVPCVVARGWTEAQKKAYVIADNQLTLNAEWDREKLKVEIGELAELDFDLDLTGFGELELKGLLQDESELGEGYDKTMEVPEDPVTQSGDLWLLGGHRLLCGDATDENAVAWLLDGAKPGIMVTDPPYGVDYDPEWRHKRGLNKSKKTGKVKNDDQADWRAAWRLFPGVVVYVWHAGLHCAEVKTSLEESGFDVRTQIIWHKSKFVLSQGHYHWGHEPCWYAVRKGKKSNWIGDRSQTTIWQIKTTDDGDETVHSTQKPIECMGRPIRNHDVDEVYDPFVGSGSTLIACDLLGKRCYAMEIDPGYCDVVVQRWQDRTGQKAVHEKSGKKFDKLRKEHEAA